VCSFPFDYKVQGYLCGGSGGYKGTHTGFYESGKLRSFFPPEDVVVDGVTCEASLFVNVNLYENGKIKSCKLAEDYHSDGKVYKRGKTIQFDKNGNIKDNPTTASSCPMETESLGFDI
jgi:antitoxin component YwqK of YwqJK toxin-antitoxin module